MSRETRANLIFLGIFLGISLPGVFIIITRRSNAAPARMSLPDAVSRRLPYMTPLETPDQVSRYVPPLTGQWVARIAKGRAGIETVMGRRWQPIVSDDHVLQAIGVRSGAANSSVFLLAWDVPYDTDLSRYAVKIVGGEDAPAVRVMGATAVPMPAEVREELMNGGYVRPPRGVVWLEAEVAGPVGGAPLELRVSHDQAATSLKLFTAADFAAP